MAAKFVIYHDKAKKFRFRLLATNGEIIASGEAYESKESCLKGIKSIQKNAPVAVLVDETKAPAKAPAKAEAKKVPAKKAAAKKPAKKEECKTDCPPGCCS